MGNYLCLEPIFAVATRCYILWHHHLRALWGLQIKEEVNQTKFHVNSDSEDPQYLALRCSCILALLASTATSITDTFVELHLIIQDKLNHDCLLSQVAVLPSKKRLQRIFFACVNILHNSHEPMTKEIILPSKVWFESLWKLRPVVLLSVNQRQRNRHMDVHTYTHTHTHTQTHTHTHTHFTACTYVVTAVKPQ